MLLVHEKPVQATLSIGCAPLVSTLRCVGLATWCGVELANDTKGTHARYHVRNASEGPEAQMTGIRWLHCICDAALRSSIVDTALGDVQKRKDALPTGPLSVLAFIFPLELRRCLSTGA
jgi:hypothetical protein